MIGSDSLQAGLPPLRLGIAGLGLAGAFMIRAAAHHPCITLAAAMDPLAKPREAFARHFGARVYEDFDDLCRDRNVEGIYIASPHRFHADQAIQALQSGKHVLVEKPLALTMADCDRVVAVAEASPSRLIVGHTHAFDPNVREMRRLIETGDLGRLGMVLTLNYNDFLMRPHRADEFDERHGGGIVFNQVAHQIEIVRLLGGDVRSVKAAMGALDPLRAAPGHCTALMDLASGAAASVTFSAYDFFDSDELHGWVSEGGAEKERGRQGKTRQAFLSRPRDLEAHQDLGFGSRELPLEQPFLPHFGFLVATCERGDLRLSPDGIVLHGSDGTSVIGVPRGPGRPGQGDALDALWSATRLGEPSRHDARWGRHTVEVVLAILESARSRREIVLET